MINCAICNEEFIKITGQHTKTHGMTLAEYNKFVEEHTDTLDIVKEEEETTTIVNVTSQEQLSEFLTSEEGEDVISNFVSGEERVETIFGKQERDTNRPLQDFLNEFDVTEKELRAVVRNYTEGARIDPRIDSNNKQKIALREAEKLKNESNIETTNIYVAECLVDNFGFKCPVVLDPTDTKPRTWVLEKQ